LLLEDLESSLRALIAQAQAYGDSAWIRQQGAAEIAILHGVLVDKVMRMLELLEPALSFLSPERHPMASKSPHGSIPTKKKGA
jgi:hypothetical protein